MPFRGKNRERRTTATACVLCAVAFSLPAQASAGTGSTAPPPGITPGSANPLAGNGMWIWVLANSGGSATAVAQQANRFGINVVFVKSGDAANYWSQFSPALVNTLHNSGVKVCAWQFVYGGDPVGEAKVGAQAVEAGADCLVIDAESSYEGRYAQAQTYMTRLRAKVGPNYPIGLAGFPYVDYHPTYPFSVFFAPGNAQYNLPQMYWRAIGTSVAANFAHTYTFNRPYGAPIYPLGQTWQDPPRNEILGFRRLAKAYGAAGVSWWSWQETQGREWNWVGRSLGPTSSRPAVSRGYATLGKGSKGDLVIWAQQHLDGAGENVQVDGSFGPGTVAAVRDFQQSEGIPQTGVIGAITWKALLKHHPVATNWSKRRTPKLAAASGADAFSPVTPSEPFGFELAPTPGIP